LKQETTEVQNQYSPNNWTNWFVKIMEYMLGDYQGKIKITSEYPLFSDPPRIDIVIVKLLEDFVIENTVGKFFKMHNVIEFKSPKDTLNIKSFKKVIGYSFFYMSQNNVEPKDTAISFVSVRHPKRLINYLKKTKIYEIIPSQDSGIYYIVHYSKSECPLPKMQLVVSSELLAEDVQWLEMLRDNLSVGNLEKCFELYEQAGEYREQIEEVLRGLLMANDELLEKEEFMTRMEKRFNERFTVFAEKTGMAQNWEQRYMQQGAQEVINLIKKGLSLQEIEKRFAQNVY
jgi:hypothetical protein